MQIQEECGKKGYLMQPLVFNTKLESPSVRAMFGSLEAKKYICILDLELTCWDQTDPNKQEQNKMEIIELGVVVFNTQTKSIESQWNRVVRPTQFPTLTDYCKNLTHISQDEVDSAPGLLQVLDEQLKQGFLPHPKDFTWAAWGTDPKGLQEEIEFRNGPGDPWFDPRYINIKLHFSARHKRCGLKEALRILNIEQTLPQHRALPDAISTFKVLERLQLESSDALVSIDKTYKETVQRIQREMAGQFSKKFNFDLESSQKLLKQVGWNFTIAANVHKIFYP